MTNALSALTTRGRSFLAAGIAALLCAFLLGEYDLVRVAVLVVALPLLAAAGVARTRYRLGSTRRLDTGSAGNRGETGRAGGHSARIPAGEEAGVILGLENVSRLPTGLLLLEDQVPYSLGSRPRFVLDRMEPMGRREVTYRVRSDARGRFRIGPLVVRIADPFGLVELTRSFNAANTLTVTPQVHPLPHVRLSGEWAGGGESLARSVAASGDDDVAPREYRHGDDLRRVHWRSTARHGELMVRREEQHWQSRGALVLDTRRRAHRGEGPASSFEVAVSAAASIGVHLGREGMGLKFLTDQGGVTLPETQFGWALLDTLAVVRPSPGAALDGGLAELRGGSGYGLVIAVLGGLGWEEARSVARVRQGRMTGVVVLLDVGSWQGAPDGEPYLITKAIFEDAGWRVVPLPAGGSLATAWKSLEVVHA